MTDLSSFLILLGGYVFIADPQIAACYASAPKQMWKTHGLSYRSIQLFRIASSSFARHEHCAQWLAALLL